MILKKGFFLVELMIALSILSTFIIIFLRFSYVSMQTRKVALNRLKRMNELILNIDTRSVYQKNSSEVRSEKYKIKISEHDFFCFKVCEGVIHSTGNHFMIEKQKIRLVAPC